MCRCDETKEGLFYVSMSNSVNEMLDRNQVSCEVASKSNPVVEARVETTNSNKPIVTLIKKRIFDACKPKQRVQKCDIVARPSTVLAHALNGEKRI
jgi:hypothetical protein